MTLLRHKGVTYPICRPDADAGASANHVTWPPKCNHLVFIPCLFLLLIIFLSRLSNIPSLEVAHLILVLCLKSFAHVFSQAMYTNTSCQILFQCKEMERRGCGPNGETTLTRETSDSSERPTCSVHLTFASCLRAMLYPQLKEK